MGRKVIGYEIVVEREVIERGESKIVKGKVMAIMDKPHRWANGEETDRMELFLIYPPDQLGMHFRGMGSDSPGDFTQLEWTAQLLLVMSQRGDIQNPRYSYVFERILAVVTDLTAQIVINRIKSLTDTINDQFQGNPYEYAGALMGALSNMLTVLGSRIPNLPNKDGMSTRRGAQTTMTNAQSAITALWCIMSFLNHNQPKSGEGE